MNLKTENFFKSRVLNSKISIFLATTFSVLIMGVLGLVSINYNVFSNTLKENISFNLVIDDDAQELEIQQLIKSLNLLNPIKSVHYISKEQAAQNLQNTIGEDFIDVLGENPLSNMIEVKFFSNHITNLNLEEQKNTFLLYEEIADVFYDTSILSLLTSEKFKKIELILLCIAVLFFIIAFILINSNIRLTIYSKRFLLKTMQLVGATKKFIQRPFLISSLISSFAACLVGNAILVFLLTLTIREIPEVQTFISIKQLVYLIAITSSINLIISFFSTWVCVRKYLNLKTEELYK